ncbi:MAG: glycosyltransferase family protein [Anaerolineales bacterium]
MAPRVVAIIQARMASSRLPGKVLAHLGGQPVLAWVMRRASRAAGIHQIIVATSVATEDDVIAAFCKEQGFACCRGDLHDVLDRYVHAARQYDAEVVVRLTGDCPFIDPEMLADNLRTFLEAQPPLDFAANRLPSDRTIPIGLDAEFCTMAALEIAWREAQEPHQREHVMPFFYEHPDRFRILHIKHSPNYGHYRWTVDTSEDLELLRQIASNFKDDEFSWKEVLALFERKPELAQINAAIEHKTQRDVDRRQ